MHNFRDRNWKPAQEAAGIEPLRNALSGGGVIEQALAPRTRPDPCA
jgi:hypothetical protein